MNNFLDHKENVLGKHFSSTLSAIIADQVHAINTRGIAVAFSGGLDSSVLLRLTTDFARDRNLPIFAFHIHHGLSPNADNWLSHCKSVCEQTGVTFSSKKVIVANAEKNGIEAAAREERYRALGVLCSEYQLSMILTAHHQDDQAETVLLQLLRGSGVAGLSGMDIFNYAPKLLGNSEVLMVRPLLQQSKEILLAFAEKHKIDYVSDESNFDSRFARNALRLQVMPALSKISPGFTERLVRSAKHAQSAKQLLLELAQLDLDKFLSEDGLDIQRMRQLSQARIENVLRFWLLRMNVQMPSTARLTEMRSQLFEARDDARITIYHDRLEIHRYKNKILALDRPLNDCDSIKPVDFIWSGEASLRFPEFGGSMYFESSNCGVATNWLRQQNLSLRIRRGGERLQLAENRPTRDLKSHFQTLKIPFWQRQRLPLLFVDDHLLHASLVGTEASYCERGPIEVINFNWQADA